MAMTGVTPGRVEDTVNNSLSNVYIVQNLRAVTPALEEMVGSKVFMGRWVSIGLFPVAARVSKFLLPGFGAPETI